MVTAWGASPATQAYRSVSSARRSLLVPGASLWLEAPAGTDPSAASKPTDAAMKMARALRCIAVFLSSPSGAVGKTVMDPARGARRLGPRGTDLRGALPSMHTLRRSIAAG